MSDRHYAFLDGNTVIITTASAHPTVVERFEIRLSGHHQTQLRANGWRPLTEWGKRQFMGKGMPHCVVEQA